MGGQLGQTSLAFSNTATIADGEGVDLRPQEIVAVVFPDGWDGGNLSIQARMHPRNDTDRVAAAADYLPVVDSDGNAVVIAGVENTYVVPTPALLVATYGLSQAQFVAASAVGDDFEVILILKPR